MDFLLNQDELAAIWITEFTTLSYLRGIRPYMDAQTGLLGIKIGIRYQSISEQLYVEPHPGIKSAQQLIWYKNRFMKNLSWRRLRWIASKFIKLNSRGKRIQKIIVWHNNVFGQPKWNIKVLT